MVLGAGLVVGGDVRIRVRVRVLGDGGGVHGFVQLVVEKGGGVVVLVAFVEDEGSRSQPHRCGDLIITR